MKEFKLPDLGEGLQEVEIISWHVGEGDNVVADQPLLSVETDKAVVEVPAPVSGRILKLFGKAGDVIKIGTVLVEYDQGEKSDAGSVVGSVPQQAAPTGLTGGIITPSPALSSVVMPARSGSMVMPAVRMLAQQLGVDLNKLTGTGPGGSITREDVESAGSAPKEGYEALKGPRKAMSAHMSASRDAVSPATISDEVDINHWFKQQDVTTRLVQALTHACQTEPSLNAWFDRDARKLHSTVDLGVAVDTPEGLFVPVLRDVAKIDPSQIRPKIDALKNTVIDRTISAESLKGATITLSNYGMMGGRFAVMVVVPPQVAILGAGRIQQRVVVADGQPAVHWVMPLSLTIDHRAVTGGEAARFLSAVMKSLSA